MIVNLITAKYILFREKFCFQDAKLNDPKV